MGLERNIGQNPISEDAFTPEPQEVGELTTAIWFAGALEIGGIISFGVQGRNTKYPTSYPYVSFHDSNKQSKA